MDRQTIQNINYTSLNDYNTAKNEIEKLLKQYYPDNYKNYISTGGGAPVVSMFAFISEILSFTQGQYFNQLFPQTVTDYQSAINLAQWRGLRDIGASLPWVAVKATITAPANAGTVSRDTLPKIIPGAILSSRDSNIPDFTLASEIDFSKIDESEWTKYFNASGSLTRVEIPAIGYATSYIVNNYNTTISTPTNEFEPFYEISLPQPNVQQIVSVTDDSGDIYYEVDYLAQDNIFDHVLNENSQNDNIPYLLFDKKVPRRFIKKSYVGTDNQIYTKIVFGNTDEASYNEYLYSINPNDLVLPAQLSGISAQGISIQKLANKEYDPNNLLVADSLGIAPSVGSIVSVEYISGGGNIKVEAGRLNRIRNVTWSWKDNTYSSDIMSSLVVNNDNQSSGGRDKLTIEEIKHLLMQRSETQKRAVTPQDYISIIQSMPSYLGRPDKIYVSRANEAIDPFKFFIYMLSIDKNGYYTDPTTNNAFIHNLKIYLKKYKSLNDLIILKKGNVANILINFNIIINKSYKVEEVSFNTIQYTKKFFAKENWDFGKHIYIDELSEYIRQNVNGIVSIGMLNIKTPIQDSSEYSMNSFYNGLTYDSKRRMYFVPSNTIIEVKYPNRDIIINADIAKG